MKQENKAPSEMKNLQWETADTDEDRWMKGGHE